MKTTEFIYQDGLIYSYRIQRKLIDHLFNKHWFVFYKIIQFQFSKQLMNKRLKN